MRYNKYTFRHGSGSISVSLKYSRRKTVGIAVYPDKKIVVTAPVGTELALIQKVIERKSEWITRKLMEAKKYQSMERTREYAGGQTIKILGRDYMIKVTQIPDFKEEEVLKESKLIKVYVHDVRNKKHIHLLIEDWYRNEAMVYLAGKFEQCYEKIKKYGILKPFYYLRYMKRRWGSCTSKGVILLNPEIFQLPPHCIEYIITHELCHLKHKNHSREFYRFLESVLPNWEEYSEALDSFLQI